VTRRPTPLIGCGWPPSERRANLQRGIAVGIGARRVDSSTAIATCVVAEIVAQLTFRLFTVTH